MAFENLLAGIRERRDKFKEAQDQVRIQKMVEDRMKSANERELERFQSEAREEEIKQQLDIIRKKKTHDFFSDNSVLDKTNIFDHSPTMMKQDKNVLTNNKDLFSNKGGMFFK